MNRMKNWRTLRTLNKQADKIIKAYSQDIIDAKNSEERHSLEWNKQAELDDIVPEILHIQTQRLFRQANKLDIIIPDDEDWFSQEREYRVLNPDGATKLRVLIRQKKRENIEWWVSKIIVPIAGLLITILSLIVAILALRKN